MAERLHFIADHQHDLYPMTELYALRREPQDRRRVVQCSAKSPSMQLGGKCLDFGHCSMRRHRNPSMRDVVAHLF